MKVLVTGAGGQLGWDVCQELERRKIEHLGTTSADLDITNAPSVAACLENYRPAAVIHCAAYTAVDQAESDRERCFAVNERGTRNLAQVCKTIGAKLLYLSTDYVFPGKGEQAYNVTDPTGPQNVYGESKLAGENAVREALSEYFIVRISWVFGINGKNFIKTMLRLAETHREINVVCDQIGSPTYTADLAPLLSDMIGTEKYGTYHATNEGLCSWSEFAQEIFRLSGKNTLAHSIPTSEYPTPAARPLNSRLSKASLDVGGFSRLPDWQNALHRYMQELPELKEKGLINR
jgi:dTDP-4-dehydrorhamnose reductase